MITTSTPGAYSTKLDKGRRKGYAKRITKERVEALRAQGLPYAEIAKILEVSIEAIRQQRKKWRREQGKPQEGAEVRE